MSSTPDYLAEKIPNSFFSAFFPSLCALDQMLPLSFHQHYWL